MITRGYLIGEIIDELSAIAQQVETRCRLGLTDLNVFLECFFRDMLNAATQDLQLRNLNEERSNEPGLDLGDDIKGVAFQITSTKTSAKINHTLESITPAQKSLYNEINILVIGHKQTRYDGLNDELCNEIGFLAENNIWDIDTVAARCLSLPLDRLQAAHSIIRKDCARVRVELEIRNEDGRYQTMIEDYIEAVPKHKVGTCETLVNCIREKHSVEVNVADYLNGINTLVSKLRHLPRITRDVYGILLTNFEEYDDVDLTLNYAVFKRKCRYGSLDEELVILGEYGLAEVKQPDDHRIGLDSPKIVINGSYGNVDSLIGDLVEYVKDRDLQLHRMIVDIDLSSL
ncbi:MAG TPA: SMEK domain-containing protein [Armatimonadota bacterium]